MNFKIQPALESDLIILRPLIKEDFDNLFIAASDPLIWEQHQNKNRYTLTEFTEFFNESLNSKSALTIIDRKNKNIIGTSRFKIIDELEEVVEIGWSFLSRKYWGGSFNREMKKLMVNHALKSYQKIIFYVNPNNFRSQRALEKLGAERMKHSTESWVLPETKGVTYMIDAELA